MKQVAIIATAGLAALAGGLRRFTGQSCRAARHDCDTEQLLLQHPVSGVSDSQFLAVATVCRRFSPAGTQPTAATGQQVLDKLVKFAQCMRSHGVSNWPDPERVSAVGRRRIREAAPISSIFRGCRASTGVRSRRRSRPLCASAYNASTSPMSPGPDKRRSGRLKFGLLTALLGGLALLAASCGGSTGNHAAQHGSTTGSGGSARGSGSISVLAFSRCMRSHGVPNFPDPVDGDSLPKISVEGLGVSNSQFDVAERGCQRLLPTGEISGSRTGISATVERCIVGGICPNAVTHWLQGKELKFAQCMRSHGVPNWPEPSTDSQGRVYFRVSRAWAASPPEPADRDCGRLTGAPIG
jgi:hypothetical protein